MREAVAALIDHCFGCLDMNRVESTVNPGNVAAIRLLEGLGFRLEGGPMRGRQRVGSEFRDLSMFGLLREEWQKSTRSAPTLARLAAPVPQESMA
jgi:RimJ/RimL family protein N-acetyltransferase